MAKAIGSLLDARNLEALSMFHRRMEWLASSIDSWVPVSSQAFPRPITSTVNSLFSTSSVRLKVEQNQLVSGDGWIGLGSIGLQGA